MSEYDPIAKAQDATTFAASRFGTHYLERLGEVRDDHYNKARAAQKAGDFNLVATEIARADEIDGEIAYFVTAKQINDSPKLMQRIRDSLKKKESTNARQDD